MRRGVNGEADFEIDWSSFQSLKEGKMKRLWWLEVWDYKRRKKSYLEGLFFFFFLYKRVNSVESFKGDFRRGLWEGFCLWVLWVSGVKRSSNFWGSWICLKKLCILREQILCFLREKKSKSALLMNRLRVLIWDMLESWTPPAFVRLYMCRNQKKKGLGQLL